MLYQKSLTNLAKAPDLWAAVGPGSEARSQQWLERQGDGTVNSFIITCRQAYQALDAQWGPMIEANAPLWGKEVYPKLSNALAADKLKHDVPIVSAAFTGTSNNFAEVMRQNTAINAFMQARNSMSGGTGAAEIDTFAQTRADIQARNTYNSIAQQAMAWVPILNIVLTVVFFAMFPVVFPLFLMPQTGVSTLKGYVTGFFYLAAWGPLYVILHMICMTRATSAATGVAEGGVTLASYAGIGAVNGETARSEEHTSELQSLMRIPYAVFCLKKKQHTLNENNSQTAMLSHKLINLHCETLSIPPPHVIYLKNTRITLNRHIPASDLYRHRNNVPYIPKHPTIKRLVS